MVLLDISDELAIAVSLLESKWDSAKTKPLTSISWDWRLSEEDMTLLIRFRQQRYPESESYYRSYNFLAAQAILDGMCAHGWTYDRLLSRPGALMRSLLKYLDRRHLIQGETKPGSESRIRKRGRLHLDRGIRGTTPIEPLDLPQHPFRSASLASAQRCQLSGLMGEEEEQEAGILSAVTPLPSEETQIQEEMADLAHSLYTISVLKYQ